MSKGKKIVLIDIDSSLRLKSFIDTLSRNGFEFVSVLDRESREGLGKTLGIELRKLKPESDKLSLAIIEPVKYLDHLDFLRKCPILCDTQDFGWYIEQMANSHNGRISDSAYNWLKLKVTCLSNHISFMEMITQTRP